VFIYIKLFKRGNWVKALVYCAGTYWSLVAYIYHIKEEDYVKTLAYFDGWYWSIVPYIYIYIYRS